MKYTQSYGKRKLGGGFYIAIALSLLIIGGVAWFALSRSNMENTAPKNSSQPQEYNNNTSSYNESDQDIIDEVLPNTDTTENVENEPYSSEEATVEQTEILSFTMPVQGEIIKNHSDTELQYSATYGDMRIHSGIDIACEKGTSISACGNGTVTSIELNTTLGNVVTIDHGNGITVKYAAIDNLNVKQGDTVKTGDIIGTVGTVPSECSDKSHIHIEALKDGKSVSPFKALGLE